MSGPLPWWKRLWPGPSTAAARGTCYGAPELINEIRKVRLPFGYGMWSIGLTDDLVSRRQELESPSHWQAWPVESASVARYVLQHFAGRGMHCQEADISGRFVYIHLVEEWRRTAAA